MCVTEFVNVHVTVDFFDSEFQSAFTIAILIYLNLIMTMMKFNQVH